jgi:hypothetical protein
MRDGGTWIKNEFSGEFHYVENTINFALKYYHGRNGSIGIIRTGAEHFFEAGLEVLDGLWRNITGNDNAVYDTPSQKSYWSGQYYSRYGDLEKKYYWYK